MFSAFRDLQCGLVLDVISKHNAIEVVPDRETVILRAAQCSLQAMCALAHGQQ